ncbi:hypothetical protein BDF21DRAFT_337722, partial [Thamnidium elegans]
ELIPIEQFWVILKGKAKHNKLSDIEPLTRCINETSEAVPAEHFRAFVQHSVSRFDNCLNEVAI